MRMTCVLIVSCKWVCLVSFKSVQCVCVCSVSESWAGFEQSYAAVFFLAEVISGLEKPKE